jgi:tetratricopeptide (TPR) repeat protein
MAKKRNLLQSFVEIPDDKKVVRLIEYEITELPIPDHRYRRLPQHVKEKIDTLYYKAQKKPQEAIPELLEMIEKYPDVPQLFNFLSIAYSMTGQKKAAEETILENIRRNPNYLFARLNLAEMLLARGDVKRVAAIFENKFDLQMLYPQRKQFHISEVVGFAGIMGVYFLKIGKRKTAKLYYEILKQIAPHHRLTRRLQRGLLFDWLGRLLTGKGHWKS